MFIIVIPHHPRHNTAMSLLANIRRDYATTPLTEALAPSDPDLLFATWMQAAVEAQVLDPTAMTLATSQTDGTPSARTVLLKEFTPAGFVFFTNYSSHKAHDLEANPKVCLLFFWPELSRQVIITGSAVAVTRAETEAYFQSRPRASQIAAWASHQSAVISSRNDLEEKFAELDQKFADAPVPTPEFWGGYRVTPQKIEFWQGRKNRLHDRLLYTRTPTDWILQRLAP